MSIEVRRAETRFTTTAPGRVTRHSFSFGTHYDPANTSFGSLVCHNDDTLSPGAGYPEQQTGAEPRLEGADEVPAGFRALVEEYYRSLARSGRK